MEHNVGCLILSPWSDSIFFYIYGSAFVDLSTSNIIVHVQSMIRPIPAYPVLTTRSTLPTCSCHTQIWPREARCLRVPLSNLLHEVYCLPGAFAPGWTVTPKIVNIFLKKWFFVDVHVSVASMPDNLHAEWSCSVSSVKKQILDDILG